MTTNQYWFTRIHLLTLRGAGCRKPDMAKLPNVTSPWRYCRDCQHDCEQPRLNSVEPGDYSIQVFITIQSRNLWSYPGFNNTWWVIESEVAVCPYTENAFEKWAEHPVSQQIGCSVFAQIQVIVGDIPSRPQQHHGSFLCLFFICFVSWRSWKRIYITWWLVRGPMSHHQELFLIQITLCFVICVCFFYYYC